MRGRRQAEGLRLSILVGMKTCFDFAIADDDHGQHEAEEHSAYRDYARKADRLEHDVAKTRDLVRLDDFDYDRRGRRLHQTIVQQGLRSVRL